MMMVTFDLPGEGGSCFDHIENDVPTGAQTLTTGMENLEWDIGNRGMGIWTVATHITDTLQLLLSHVHMQYGLETEQR